MRVWVLCGLAWLAASCGPSELYEEFSSAATKQQDLDSQTLKLWKRNPIIDAQDTSLTANDDLDFKVPRTAVSFAGLTDPKGGMRSSDLIVYESSAERNDVSFFDWAGTLVSWKKPEFQVLLAYYQATKAQALASRVLPDADFSNIFPITIFAREDGSVFSTAYTPTSKVISIYYDSEGLYPDFHMVDDSDVTFHEFGHVVQHAANENVLEFPVADDLDDSAFTLSGTTAYSLPNRDLDAIVEGLADVYSSATARDDTITSWAEAHLPSIIGTGSRVGNDDRRSPKNTLSFPAAYHRDAHSDGRVVSGTINDIRRLLAGESVTLPPDCTSSCTTAKLSSGSVSSDTSYDRAMELAYRAFATLSTSSTFFAYGNALLNRCDTSILSWCTSAVKAEIVKILSGRGLKPSTASSDTTLISAAQATSGIVISPSGATATGDLYFPATIGTMPFPDDTGFANTDSDADPCEVLLIYPNMQNKSTSSIYDITVTLQEVTGFTNMAFPSSGKTVEEVVNTASASRKMLGWMEPNEDTVSLLDFVRQPTTATRWYAAAGGSYFTQKLGGNAYPSPQGWLVRAPNDYGKGASATFRITARRYNSDIVNVSGTSQFSTFVVKQTLTTVADTTKANSNFCQ